jgi:selenocysteine lyase/cysteine desulfurase
LQPKEIATVKIKFINPNANKYFDYTASGLCVESIEAEMKQISAHYANTHSKDATLSNYMNEHWTTSRNALFKLLEINPFDFEIIPAGYGSTAAIKKFQELIGIYLPPRTKRRCEIKVIDKPVVLVGPYEHHSNDVSYRESIADIIRLNLNDTGTLCLLDLEKKLQENKNREIYICLSVASNVTGIITDVQAVSVIARKYNAVLCLDAATSSPYINIPSSFYDVMFMSPHKCIGGPGSVGLLVIRKSLVDTTLPPTFAGGGTVCYVNSEEHYYDDDLHIRENAGTPGILQFIKTAKAYKLRNDFGLDKIKNIKKELHRYFVSEVSTFPNVTVYGNMDVPNIGICSLNVKGFTPEELCEKLSTQYQLETRAGCSCAGPYGHILLGLPNDPNSRPDMGWLRISIHYTHTKDDVDYLLNALKEIITPPLRNALIDLDNNTTYQINI